MSEPKVVACRYPDCHGSTYARELCSNHYTSARRASKEKRTTWQELESAGKSGPARSPGKRVNDWFTTKQVQS